ncbi:MAG: V-type ATP synthase subunit F [Clostridiales bacterium]|jgi:V/A-type H+-transporting ATPase subunit F|nr:V-type ATP synthase subunit F [Clostridiales bacterium]
MKIYAICDNTDTRTGLRLAGIDGALARGTEELKELFDAVLNDKDIGILLITEKLARLMPETINDIKLGRREPLIVEIPDGHGSGRRPDFITAYIREAIGVNI